MLGSFFTLLVPGDLVEATYSYGTLYRMVIDVDREEPDRIKIRWFVLWSNFKYELPIKMGESIYQHCYSTVDDGYAEMKKMLVT